MDNLYGRPPAQVSLTTLATPFRRTFFRELISFSVEEL